MEISTASKDVARQNLCDGRLALQWLGGVQVCQTEEGTDGNVGSDAAYFDTASFAEMEHVGYCLQNIPTTVMIAVT